MDLKLNGVQALQLFSIHYTGKDIRTELSRNRRDRILLKEEGKTNTIGIVRNIDSLANRQLN